MRKVISINSPRTIDDAIKQLQRLRQQRIPELCKKAIEKCADLGIEVATANLGTLDYLGNPTRFVGFKKTFESKVDGYSGLLIMYDQSVILQSWLGYDVDKHKKVVRTAEVSPTLMYEFGSGSNANASHMIIFQNDIVAGQGTFPSENNRPWGNVNHGKDGQWSWRDLNGDIHKFDGIKPTMPMYNAWLEMDKQIETIGKQVFRGL